MVSFEGDCLAISRTCWTTFLICPWRKGADISSFFVDSSDSGSALQSVVAGVRRRHHLSGIQRGVSSSCGKIQTLTLYRALDLNLSILKSRDPSTGHMEVERNQDAKIAQLLSGLYHPHSKNLKHTGLKLNAYAGNILLFPVVSPPLLIF